MKNMLKVATYSLVWFASIAYSNVSALETWVDRVDGRLKWWKDNWWDIYATITNLVAYLLGFLALIAVIFAIYGGFQILTAGWDDGKVKKWKTTLINAILGLFVIWISWALVSWILKGLSGLQ